MTATGARRAIPGIVLVVLLAWMVRLQYLALLPSFAYSWDMACWEEIAGFIGSGTNPYATTASLSWPPLWMICLFVLDRAAELGRFEFLDVLRAFLLLIETIGIVLAWRLARAVFPDRDAMRALLFGLALNPVAILLTCQHGNFDAMVAMWVVAALLALAGFHRTRDPLDWLLACFLLGLGVLTKTVPFALAPLLLPGARAMGVKARVLGATLFAGPSALGLGVLFALSPGTIIERVFLYSPVPGRFGFTGIASLLGATEMIPAISRLSSLLILAMVAWGAVRAWSWRDPRESQIVLLAGLVLLAIPTLGPGFGPQYAFWFLAPLAVAFVGASRGLRVALLTAFAITAVTYLVLYGFARDLGQPVPYFWWSDEAVQLGRTITRDVPRAALSLPMWISWLIVLIAGVRELRRGGAIVAEAQ